MYFIIQTVLKQSREDEVRDRNANYIEREINCNFSALFAFIKATLSPQNSFKIVTGAPL